MESNLASFAARARVIDLLGREQIADAPTAMSELLKNAIDAGAANSTIRFRKEPKILEIEDNGLGMRQSDLLGKWLVVATESKRGETDIGWLKFASATQREAITGHKPFGEKGIGRLAVSSLGRAVLVWTRWGTGEEREATLMLVHWDLFRHPRLTLDEIKVPYARFDKADPSGSDVKALMVALADGLAGSKRWESALEQELKRRILCDLRDVFPASVDQVSFARAESGTLFTILGTTSEVDDALGNETNNGEFMDATEGVKTLIAFSDPFGEQSRKLAINVRIDSQPVLEDRRFWRKDDLKDADHQIDLLVAQDGFVRGKVRRFSQWFDYEYQTKPLAERATSPGSFRVVLGYVAGTDSESRLPEEQRKAFDQRLKAYGALYVYRDGVRILPYGRTDNDFLNFETRRSYNAGRYFFSHRRMFGAIYLTSGNNTELREKAGREGFIKNGAYRGFYASLVDIFIELADTYFGTNPLIEKPQNRRSPNRRRAKDKLKQRAEKEKAEFLRDLESWRRRLPLARRQMETTFEATSAQIKNAETQMGYKAQRMQSAFDMLDRCRSEFAVLISDMGTEPPKLAPLNRAEQSVLDSYLTDRQGFEEEAIKKIAQAGARCAQIAKSILPDEDRTDWLTHRIADSRALIARSLDRELTDITQLTEVLTQVEFRSWRDTHEAALSRVIDEALSDQNGETQPLDSPERLKTIVEGLTRMEIELREIYLPFWRAVKGQLENLRESEGSDEMMGDLHRRTEFLEEQSRVLGELAQLGLIVESLDHEYRSLFYNVDQKLLQLGAYVSPQGQPTLDALSKGLSSLENKQNLLTPLHQRRTSATFDISGNDVRDFLEKMYPEARRQGTKLEYTPDFLKTVLRKVNPATIYASVTNLVANSLYWVSKSSRDRAVRLSVFSGGIVISDSGPGVAPRDRPRIFEAFFGRRPNGRGLGLYIAKSNLEAAGCRLDLLEDPPKGTLPGAVFLISPPNE